MCILKLERATLLNSSPINLNSSVINLRLAAPGNSPENYVEIALMHFFALPFAKVHRDSGVRDIEERDDDDDDDDDTAE